MAKYADAASRAVAGPRAGGLRLAQPRMRLDQPRDVRRQMLPRWDPEAFGNWSERFARFLGTARFLVYMTVFIVVWIAWNAAAPVHLRWDQYPFIFLTLILSLQASYAAPLILLAQNRQADRDRVGLDEDRAQNSRAKADMEYLAREMAAIRISLGEVTTRDFVRSEIARLAEHAGRLGDLRDDAHRPQQTGTQYAEHPADEHAADERLRPRRSR